MTKERSILYALILTATFFLVEAIGGVLTESLALISDAAHMLTDVTALIISFIAIKVGQKKADHRRTFGYYRFEILAATLNTLLLFLVAIYILYEAYQRISHPPEIQTWGMLLIAVFGLIVNLISMKLLMINPSESLNIKSAYLEVWSDSLGSLGVIFGALAIQFFHWKWVDSIVAISIGLWILPRSWILLKASINILLEGVPEGLEVKQIYHTLSVIEGVLNVHELHVWAIANDKISLTAHVVIESNQNFDEMIAIINQVLSQKFSITHTTLQLEYEKCMDHSTDCYFDIC